MKEFTYAIDAINTAILKAEHTFKKNNILFRVTDSEKEEFELHIQGLKKAKEFLVCAPSELQNKDREIQLLREKLRKLEVQLGDSKIKRCPVEE